MIFNPQQRRQNNTSTSQLKLHCFSTLTNGGANEITDFGSSENQVGTILISNTAVSKTTNEVRFFYDQIKQKRGHKLNSRYKKAVKLDKLTCIPAAVRKILLFSRLPRIRGRQE